MSTMVRPNAPVLTDLAAVLASTNWTATKMHLSQADFTPTKQSVLADFATLEADFDGYAAATITFGSPYVDAAGNPQAVGNNSFIATGATTPNTLYTWFITNTAGTTLLAGGRLDDAPVSIINTGDGIALTTILGLGEGSVVTVG